MKSLSLFRAAFLLFFLGLAYSTEAQNYQKIVEMSDPEQNYFQVKAQFEEGFPKLLEEINNSIEALNTQDISQSLSGMKTAQDYLRQSQDTLTDEDYFSGISPYFDKVGTFLTAAESSLQQSDFKQAKVQLQKAYGAVKALADSPVLKITAAEIALRQAEGQIAGKDYRSAGLFLDRAIDKLAEVQQDPQLDSEQIAKLKNDMIITKQQVVLGELNDLKKLKNFYPGLGAARTDTMHTYYNMWTRSDAPWLQY